jgi:hypothetical protein
VGRPSTWASTAPANRSQVIFTTIKGREGIFWQTPKTTRGSRPGVLVPARRASGLDDLTISVDTRERYPFRFARQRVSIARRPLPAGDYAVEHQGEILDGVERKSLADLASSLIDSSLTYALAELATLPHAAVVVEDAYSGIFKLAYTGLGRRRSDAHWGAAGPGPFDGNYPGSTLRRRKRAFERA